jgi:6-phosphogluconolactonase (cycloisomerase 2 family)
VGGRYPRHAGRPIPLRLRAHHQHARRVPRRCRHRRLTAIDTYPTEKQPRGFTIDPSGKFLLAVGQLSNSMTSYAIDKKDGKLTKLKEYPMGKNPNWVEIVKP